MLFFGIVAVALVSLALTVVLMKNPISSAVALISHMILIAALFAQLDAHFLAATQIVVYVGAIMVLVIFVIMLLGSHSEEVGKGEGIIRLLAGIGGVAFLAVVLPMLLKALPDFEHNIGSGFQGSVSSIGTLLFGEYLFPFELSSIVIMVAVVGAVMLSRKRSSVPPIGNNPGRTGKPV